MIYFKSKNIKRRGIVMKKRSLCLILTLLLILGQSISVDASKMQTEKNEIYDMSEFAFLEAEREIAALPLYERYIIKLKSGNRKNSDIPIENSIKSALPDAKIAADIQLDTLLTNKKIDKAKSNDTDKKPLYKIEERANNIITVEVSEKVDANAFRDALKKDGQIEYIQPDYVLDLCSDNVILNIDFDKKDNNEKQKNTSAEQISETVGKSVIALIDSGVDLSHKDFAGRIHSSYDFVNDAEMTYDASNAEDYNHGTHIAGIVANTSENTMIMALKVFENGSAYTSDIIEAIEYADKNGADIVNLSFGGLDKNRALYETMASSQILFVCAAGNNRTNLEETAVYPACFDLDNIISVASVNEDFGLSYFSNYSSRYVDIAALGRDIESSLPENSYGKMSGTSMSAAYVSGVCGEAKAIGYDDIKTAVLDSSMRLQHLQSSIDDGKCADIDNLRHGVFTNEIIQLDPEEDFNTHGLDITPEESWELFSSVDTIAIEANNYASYALRSDGSVWAWGSNYYGLLGEGYSVINRTYPAVVAGLSNIVQISTDSNYCYAVDNQNQLWAWGANDYGQLGSIGGYSLPFLLQTNVEYAAAGDTHGVSVGIDGHITIRGAESAYSDVNISMLSGIEKAAAGGYQTLLLNNDETLTSWGYKDETNNIQHSTTPFVFSTLQDIEKIAVGDSVYALKSDGSMYKIPHAFGQEGGQSDKTPVNIYNGVKDFDVNGEQLFVIFNNGNVIAQGRNTEGQLGGSEPAGSGFQNGEISVQNSNAMNKISAGKYHTLALKDDGSVWSWGANGFGQLGDNTLNSRSTPGGVGIINDMRNGSTYQKAYILNEHSIVTPSTNTGTNWFEFTPSESGYYLIEGWGNSLNSIEIDDEYPSAYLYSSVSLTNNEYIEFSDGIDINENNQNGYFSFERELVGGKTYYIKVENNCMNSVYGLRAEARSAILQLGNSDTICIEAEDAVLSNWETSSANAGYIVVNNSEASGGLALKAYGHNDGASKVEDASEIALPPLTFSIRSNNTATCYIWVRSHIINNAQDSFWLNIGRDENYTYQYAGLNIGTESDYWRWTCVASGIGVSAKSRTIGFCPREINGLIDQIIVTTDASYVPSGSYMECE